MDRNFFTNSIIEENDVYDRISGPREDEVVLIRNPRNRLGPKHVYTKDTFPKSVCGQYDMTGGTSTLRASANLEDCHEIVDLEEFEASAEIICKRCSSSFN